MKVKLEVAVILIMVTGGHYIVTQPTDWSITMSHDDLVITLP